MSTGIGEPPLAERPDAQRPEGCPREGAHRQPQPSRQAGNGRPALELMETTTGGGQWADRNRRARAEERPEEEPEGDRTAYRIDMEKISRDMLDLRTREKTLRERVQADMDDPSSPLSEFLNLIRKGKGSPGSQTGSSTGRDRSSNCRKTAGRRSNSSCGTPGL